MKNCPVLNIQAKENVQCTENIYYFLLYLYFEIKTFNNIRDTCFNANPFGILNVAVTCKSYAKYRKRKTKQKSKFVF